MLNILKKTILIAVIFLLIIFGIVIFKPSAKSNHQPSTPKPLTNLTIEPTEKHTTTLIWLHGLGDSADNWHNHFRTWAKNYPHIKFIVPKAPRMLVSMNFGMPATSWYNIKGSIKDVMNLKQDKTGLWKSINRIENIIQSEIDSGIAPEKIIVGGYSQGGSLALALGLTTQQKLGKIICLSGFLPCREEIFDWKEEKNQSLPFYFYHNNSDDLVPCWAGKKSAELMREQGFTAEFTEKSGWWGHIWPWGEVSNVIRGELE